MRKRTMLPKGISNFIFFQIHRKKKYTHACANFMSLFCLIFTLYIFDLILPPSKYAFPFGMENEEDLGIVKIIKLDVQVEMVACQCWLTWGE